MDTVATIASFGGRLFKLKHQSALLRCAMDVNVFLPPQASKGKVPVLVFLSGLTCTPQNCTEKGFFQARAAEKGIALIWPDTSPRGLDIAGSKDSYDFGEGAGFYVDATEGDYGKHFKMESYVTRELTDTVFGQFPELDSSRVSLTGHSMGGHGALSLFLKYPGKYRSVSAFAPISNPSNCPWGTKAFTGYFGQGSEATWAKHDATELIRAYDGPTPEILVDVGTDDSCYKEGQLLPENLIEASKASKYAGKVKLRFHDGYDHSYFFVSSFAADHVDHAARFLV